MPLIDKIVAGPGPHQSAEHFVSQLLEQFPAENFESPAFRQQVQQAETFVASTGPSAFDFSSGTSARLHFGAHPYAAGRFETPSLKELKARVLAHQAQQPKKPIHPVKANNTPEPLLRLSILLGASPLTDIQYLEAHADGDTVFQLASQFNGLEATSPQIARVSSYFSDHTQGPLGVLPAFPGALLRHYAAPGPAGTRFVQNSEHQLNLLADVLPPAMGRVEAGYLLSQHILQPDAFAAKLTQDFDAIRIGLHRDLQVVSPGAPHLDQVLTSTLAGGAYSRSNTLLEPWLTIQRQLLRAAYLGTLLAAITHGKHKVVLTAIGGGVFANPHRLIWEAILWSLDQIQPNLKEPLHVILNLRSFDLPAETLRQEAHKRQGELVQLSNLSGSK